MQTFWGLVASNAVVASGLAVVALILGRVGRNPAAVHLLWVMVLIKLFTPPVLTAEWPLARFGVVGRVAARSTIPAVRAPDQSQARPVASSARLAPPALVDRPDASAEPTPSAGGRRLPSASTGLAAIWLTGTGVLGGIALARVRRFAAGLRGSEPAPWEIQAMAARLAEQLGLRRPPPLVMTALPLPPLVWALGPRPTVILPATLFARLDGAARRSILAHELAHIRRGDHLVRLLEVAATTIFWWHPVVWLARRQLHDLEETCCDARALDLIPDPPRTYAAALVATLEFLSQGSRPAIPLQTSLDPTLQLRRRISMLAHRRRHRLGFPGAALVAGIVAVPLVGAFAVGPAQVVPETPQVQQPAAPVPAAAPAVLRGRVTDPKDVPLAGVRVRVAVPATNMRAVTPDTIPRPLEATTDAKGEYRLELPGITGKTTASIDALQPGFQRLVGTLMAGGDARNVEVEPGKTAEALLTLKPARYYSGTVVDDQGRPVRGVEITATLVMGGGGMGYVETTATGPDGVFEIFGYWEDFPLVRNLPTSGVVIFAHPDYIDTNLENINALEPDHRIGINVVLQAGHKVTGTVLDAAGKPVPRAMVEAALTEGKATSLGDGTHRKATVTAADGKFALRGLSPGATNLSVRALEIKQITQIPLVMDADKIDLDVRLQPMALPADLKTYPVLGMQLATIDKEIQAAYGTYHDVGALVMDPGPNSDRLGIGHLGQGDYFWLVGKTRVGSVRGFVTQILAETAGRDEDAYSVRVVYVYRRPEQTGSSTQFMKLTRDDINGLKALAEQIPPKPR